MKYMLLIADDPETYAAETSADEGQAVMDEYLAFSQRLEDSGEVVDSHALQGISSATTVRIVDGKRTLTDGPFAETKEWFSGYYVIDVESLDRALELAAQIPAARHGSVEVRPIWNFDDPLLP